jgi:two-component system, NtrC family, sensor histidine kinase GlrK
MGFAALGSGPMQVEKSTPESANSPALQGSQARPKSLSTHLAISHSLPTLVVTLALALTLIALVRISVVLTTLNDTELVTLSDEGRLHRQTWALDLAMRHGQAACVAGTPGSEAIRRIRSDSDALRPLLRVASPGHMHELARGYLAIAGEILAGDACQLLRDEDLQARRSDLDEQLTNAWVVRLGELHAAVARKESEAKSIAVSATSTGIPLAALSFGLAMFTARRLARIVRHPLERLAEMARRIGRGDFRTAVHVQGPIEVLALAGELESMRSQLQQLDSLKQGFLASVSHELRTPLSKIRESLALMEDGVVGKFEARQMRVIHIARSACERQIRLVTTLLDLSRLRAGSPIRIREGTSIDAVLQAAVGDERSDAARRKVQVELVLHGPIGVCRLDPTLMERAIANLIRNAVSVSKQGQRVLVERFVEQDASGRPGVWARLTVTDEGPGVPQEIRDGLFGAFVTHPVPSSGKTLGIGLGLALAREVSEVHGGELELVRTGQGGTTFQLWLPVEQPAGEARSEGQVEPVASDIPAVPI